MKKHKFMVTVYGEPVGSPVEIADMIMDLLDDHGTSLLDDEQGRVDIDVVHIPPTKEEVIAEHRAKMKKIQDEIEQIRIVLIPLQKKLSDLSLEEALLEVT